MSHESLTPAEAERLEMLAEEAGEVVQICMKILRHGYESYHPEQNHNWSNRRELGRELEDLLAVAHEMARKGDVELGTEIARLVKRWKAKLRWTHHQEVAQKSPV